jgi:hypothetical protein
MSVKTTNRASDAFLANAPADSMVDRADSVRST